MDDTKDLACTACGVKWSSATRTNDKKAIKNTSKVSNLDNENSVDFYKHPEPEPESEPAMQSDTQQSALHKIEQIVTQSAKDLGYTK